MAKLEIPGYLNVLHSVTDTLLFGVVAVIVFFAILPEAGPRGRG